MPSKGVEVIGDWRDPEVLLNILPYQFQKSVVNPFSFYASDHISFRPFGNWDSTSFASPSDT